MVRKEFVRPEFIIVKLELNDIIATSGGAGGTIPDAPFGSRQSEWDEFEED